VTLNASAPRGHGQKEGTHRHFSRNVHHAFVWLAAWRLNLDCFEVESRELEVSSFGRKIEPPVGRMDLKLNSEVWPSSRGRARGRCSRPSSRAVMIDNVLHGAGEGRSVALRLFPSHLWHLGCWPTLFQHPPKDVHSRVKRRH
jgi:hypothetical protein